MSPRATARAWLIRLCLALAIPASALLAPGLSGQALAKDGGGHGGSDGGRGGSSGHGSGSGSSGGSRGGDSSGHGGGDSSGSGSGSSGGSASSGSEKDGDDGGRGRGKGGRKSGDRGSSGRHAGGERSAVVWSSRSGGAVEVRYGDGWSERADVSRYTLRDPDRRVVASRPARRGDLARLRALAE